MKNNKPITTLHDERTGNWTTFSIDADRMIFRRGHPKQHWMLKAFAVLILVLVVGNGIQTPFGISILALGLVVIAWNWFDLSQIKKKRYPIVILKNHENDKAHFDDGRVFDAFLIRRFIVQENKHRNTADSQLIQIYMELKNSDYLVLLYQDYYSDERKRKTEQIADQLGEWLSNIRNVSDQ